MRNLSDEVAFSYITAYGHSNDGIRVDDGITTDIFDFLTTYDNLANGVDVNTQIGGVTDSLSYNNSTFGFDLTNLGDAVIEANESYDNNYGFVVSKGSSGSEVVVGNADLSLGRGNIAYNNSTTGISGGGNVSILGNVSFGHTGSNDQGISVGSGTAGYNIVYGNYDGIVSSSSALVEYNRVYGNSNRGINASNSGSTLLGNVVYSNLVGIVAPFNQTVRNNIIYANTDYGVALTGGGPTFENNTVLPGAGRCRSRIR